MAQSPPSFPGISPPPPPWLFSPSLPLPPPPPLSSDSDKPSAQGRIIAGIFIGIVTFMIVFTTVCTLCREYRYRRARAAAIAADTRRLSLPVRGSALVDERHLRQAYAADPTAGLPAFIYSRSVKHNLAGEGEEARTCSVCLGEFQLGETVRLLPVCLHLYHAECIDPWLDAHSTCPLCRSDTNPVMGAVPLPNV